MVEGASGIAEDIRPTVDTSVPTSPPNINEPIAPATSPDHGITQVASSEKSPMDEAAARRALNNLPGTTDQDRIRAAESFPGIAETSGWSPADIAELRAAQQPAAPPMDEATARRALTNLPGTTDLDRIKAAEAFPGIAETSGWSPADIAELRAAQPVKRQERQATSELVTEEQTQLIARITEKIPLIEQRLRKLGLDPSLDDIRENIASQTKKLLGSFARNQSGIPAERFDEIVCEANDEIVRIGPNNGARYITKALTVEAIIASLYSEENLAYTPPDSFRITDQDVEDYAQKIDSQGINMYNLDHSAIVAGRKTIFYHIPGFLTDSTGEEIPPERKKVLVLQIEPAGGQEGRIRRTFGLSSIGTTREVLEKFSQRH